MNPVMSSSPHPIFAFLSGDQQNALPACITEYKMLRTHSNRTGLFSDRLMARSRYLSEQMSEVRFFPSFFCDFQ